MIMSEGASGCLRRISAELLTSKNSNPPVLKTGTMAAVVSATIGPAVAHDRDTAKSFKMFIFSAKVFCP